MKRVALLGSVLALALAGCGLISLPPIDNPFHLDGKQTTFNLEAGQVTGGASGEQTTFNLVAGEATGSANVTVIFDDLTIPNLPINPSGFSFYLAISDVSFAGGHPCPDPIPPSINVTMSATLTISDGSGDTARSAISTANDVRFTLTRSGDQIMVGNLTNGILDLNVGQILPIIQDGGLNTAVLAAQITTVSTPGLAGCAMTITWGGGEGVIRF